MRDSMAMDPIYRECLRHSAFDDHECTADPLTRRMIEWEHVWIYAGRQINEPWAIIGICYGVHRGGELNKEKNQFLSLMRATPTDLEKYPRTDWKRRFSYLVDKYYFDSHIDPLHGCQAECPHEDCWMCAVIDEIL